ncbi:MAG: helix-turn-helix domain-containing protein, partial [Clostridia bacterium]|nr:helix-turn-helix domain-containing protein [Clostridia bacterium]
CTIFKQAEGISLIKYVNMAKLRQIKTLMEKENLKLYEASQLFGFSDANYVSHLYKKTFGRSITSKPDLSNISG